jgi:signal transduction histidine kinase/ActR/RegA family two-component response regulator
MRFAGKLILLMLAIVLVIIIVVSYFAYHSSNQIMENEIKSNLENVASNATDNIDRILFDRYADIEMIAAGPILSSRNSTPNQITERMIQYRNMYKYYISLSFFDLGGVRIADSDGLGIGKIIDRSSRYWKEAVNGGFSAASDLIMDEELKIPVIYFSSLVKDKDGVPLGVVVARMPVSKLYDITENSSLIERSILHPSIDIVDKNGLLLYSNYNKKGLLKENIYDSDNIVKDFAEGRLGSVKSFKPAGGESIYFFSKEKGYMDFNGNNWTLIIKIKTEAMLEPVTAYGKKLLLIVIPITALSILLVIAFAYLISKPIVSLKNAANEVSRGNLDVKVKFKSKDELGQLAESFNGMTESLKKSQATIDNNTKTLEKKVVQRTKEYQEAALKAQVADSAKSEFLANMSHEIRTPMNAIMGFSEILKEQVSDPKHLEYVDTILSSGKTLLGLINDILDLSKIEAGKMEFQYRPVDPHALFGDITRIFAAKIKGKGLKFITDIDENLPASLLLDEVRIRQILFNLVGNAVKFTTEGYIELKVSKIFHAERSKIDLIFSVKDTGIGISAEDRKIIFDAFQQSKGQSTKLYGGTGLGLAITKKLAELMNGELMVDSTVGKGSIFTVKIKEVSISSVEHSIEELKMESENIIFKNQKVLVVDDIQSNRLLLNEILSIYGLVVLEAANGKEAINTIKSQNPDIILMDLRMPVMDGYEAIKILKADRMLKNIPVVVLTASAMKISDEDIKKIGSDGYLRKPISRPELLAELKKYLKFKIISKGETIPGSELWKVDDKGEAEVGLTDNLIKIKKLPKLVNILENDVFTKYVKIKKEFIINDIEDFAIEILELGRHYSADILSEWGTKLSLQAGNFDLENLTVTFEEFRSIVTKIKSFTKE